MIPQGPHFEESKCIKKVPKKREKKSLKDEGEKLLLSSCQSWLISLEALANTLPH